MPIVFVNVSIRSALVSSPAWHGRTATPRFLQFEYGISGKWLELLKQIVPDVTRVTDLRDPTIASGTGQFGAIQSAAPSLGVESNPIDVREPPKSNAPSPRSPAHQ